MYFESFSHDVHWSVNGFCENVRGNRERKAETELGQFTSCLMCCSHQCPTGRGGLSEAITMFCEINPKFSCDFDAIFSVFWCAGPAGDLIRE